MSNVCIIRLDWLIALYLFISLVRNTSFLIIENNGFSEELSDVNKSLCKNIFLVRAPPQLTHFHFTYHPFNGPGMCAVDNFQRLRFCSLPTSSQESVKHKSTFTFTFTLRTIYKVNDTGTWFLGVVFVNCAPSHLSPFPLHRPHPFLSLFVQGSLNFFSVNVLFISSNHSSIDQSIDPSIHPCIHH